MFSWFISFYSSAVFKTYCQFEFGVTTNVFLQEFALDLDSHKSLVRSLNVVGKHLAEHTEDEEKARETTARLVEINRRWDAMCNAAVAWEARLQTALLQVSPIILQYDNNYIIQVIRKVVEHLDIFWMDLDISIISLPNLLQYQLLFFMVSENDSKRAQKPTLRFGYQPLPCDISLERSTNQQHIGA